MSIPNTDENVSDNDLFNEDSDQEHEPVIIESEGSGESAEVPDAEEDDDEENNEVDHDELLQQPNDSSDTVEIALPENVRNEEDMPEPDDSDLDFEMPRKKRKVDLVAQGRAERAKEEEKKSAADKIDDSFDSESCPICFESWNNAGDHRLCSLKCGHLFGFGCIDKWLMGPGKSCPQCNAPSKRKDIRVIFARRLTTVDTAELDRLRMEMAEERNLRLKAQAEAVSLKMSFDLVTEECNRMRRALQSFQQRARAQGEACTSDGAVDAVRETGGYELQHTIRLTEGACRVLTACDYMNLLCVGQASPNPLFRGFGIRKVHLLDYHTDRFLVLHSQAIRDLCLHPDLTDGLLLTGSVDKTAKLVSLFTGHVVQTYTCPAPVWSVAWHRDNHHQFFTGMANGQVQQFDTRRTCKPIAELKSCDSFVPVCALQYAQRDPYHSSSDTFRESGLFVGQLDRVSFLEEQPGKSDSTSPTPGFRAHALPLEGTLAAMSFDARTRHLMTTFRPSLTQASLATVRHLVCQMETRSGEVAEAGTVDARVCTCRLVHALTGGRKMRRLVRSRLFTGPGQRLLAASGDEESAGTVVWDAAQGERLQLLKGSSGNPVIDLSPFRASETGGEVSHGLVTLTESSAQFFRWREST